MTDSEHHADLAHVIHDAIRRFAGHDLARISTEAADAVISLGFHHPNDCTKEAS